MDYENVKDIQLGLAVKNKSPYVGSSGSTDLTGASSVGGGVKTYPININVKNQPEGPRFIPSTKAIPISEGSTSFSINDVIARYTATDGDTGKPPENVRSVHAHYYYNRNIN